MLPESVQNIFEAENEEDCNCKRKKRLLEQFRQKVAMMFGKWLPVVSRKCRSDLNAHAHTSQRFFAIAFHVGGQALRDRIS